MTTIHHRKSTEAADEDDDGIGTDSNWEEMPTELLMMFFNELTFNKRKLFDPTKDLLNCRLVHPAWKCVVDALLEKRCLEHWTKWSSEESDVNPYRFPFLRLNMSTGEALRDYDDLSCLQNLMSGSCPIPTKSLCIESDQRKSQPRNNPRPWHIVKNGINFFSNIGHHLTSLTFRNLVFDLPAETLHGILSNTPNLKAMELKNVKIKESDISLPPLSHLAHVHLLDVTSAKKHSSLNLHKWILEPYKEQLVSLQTDSQFHWREIDGVLSYPSLVQLTMFSPSNSLLLAPFLCPSIKYLALKRVKGPVWENLLKFLFNFSSTLAHLHFQTTSYYFFISADEEIVTDDAPTFPLLKTLVIDFTNHGQETRLIKSLIKLFPNLEKFVFNYNQHNAKV